MREGAGTAQIVPVLLTKSLTGQGKSAENQSGREVRKHLPHPDTQQTYEV